MSEKELPVEETVQVDGNAEPKEETPVDDATSSEPEPTPVSEEKATVLEPDQADEASQDEESDFADEVKTPEQEPEEIPEEQPVEPSVDMYKSEPAEGELSGAEEQNASNDASKPDYSDPDLEGIEEARAIFHKVNRKYNIIKWILTGAALAILACSWVIPNTIPAIQEWNQSAPTIIMVCGIVVALVLMIATSAIFRKKVEKAMGEYFDAYYLHSNAYVYGARVGVLTGSVHDKLKKEDIVESNIYKDCNHIGSRATYSFDYDGVKVTVADAAAQSLEKRTQRTLFVGKYFFYDNNYKGSDILIYLKGNNRALPPNNLAGRNLLEDTRTMVIYGDGTAHKVLTKRVKDALAAFDTNKTFIDMAISIREGKTYLAVGFEDDLMVLPLKDAFDPGPTRELKKVTGQVLDLIEALNHPHDRP